MHHAFLLPEVLLRILDYIEVQPLDGFYEGYQQQLFSNAAMARLARTSRHFLEPCLNALWRCQHTLGPLVQTLPPGAYEDVVWKKTGTECFFDVLPNRPLMKSDWLRFDSYASRIKALGFHYNEYADLEQMNWDMANSRDRRRELSVKFVSQLCLYRPGRWLLPNLTRLRWNIFDAPYTSYLPLFLGPKLTSLAFAFDSKYVISSSPNDVPAIQTRMAQVLDSLADLCPSLRELEMYPEYASHIVVAAQNFGYDCQRLEGFHVDTSQHAPLDRAFITYLAAKPHLRKVYLSVNSDAAEDLPLLSYAPVYHPFPSLQVLWLKVYRLRFCTPLFVAMQHCRLYNIALETETQPLASEVVELLEAIRKHCARDTLHVCQFLQRQLILADDLDVFPPLKSDHFFDIEALSPILCFPNMRYFAFSLPLYCWLTDDDLRTIGDAWPGLVTFVFNAEWGTPTVPPATWEGVVTLVKRCPLLTELCIIFDTCRNRAEVAAGEVMRNSRLRFFDVVNSTLPEDPGDFAQALFAIAPRLLDIRMRGPWEIDAIENQHAPLPIDPSSYPKQVDSILCRMRMEYFGEEYTKDDLGAVETAELLAVESQPQEWNPWA